MSLEAILEAIRKSAQVEVEVIEAQAAAEAARITSSAQADLPGITSASQREALAAATMERSRVLHRARLQAMQDAGQARFALVERALTLAGEQLGTVRNSPDYPALFQRLLAEALHVLRGSLAESEVPIVHIDARDRALLASSLAHLGITTTIFEQVLDWGGVQVMSADERVVVDNTLRSRMIRAEPYLHRYLPRMLEAEN